MCLVTTGSYALMMSSVHASPTRPTYTPPNHKPSGTIVSSHLRLLSIIVRLLFISCCPRGSPSTCVRCGPVFDDATTTTTRSLYSSLYCLVSYFSSTLATYYQAAGGSETVNIATMHRSRTLTITVSYHSPHWHLSLVNPLTVLLF